MSANMISRRYTIFLLAITIYFNIAQLECFIKNDEYYEKKYGKVIQVSAVRLHHFPCFFSLSINTVGGTEIPVFRKCVAGMIEHSVFWIISIIKK